MKRKRNIEKDTVSYCDPFTPLYIPCYVPYSKVQQYLVLSTRDKDSTHKILIKIICNLLFNKRIEIRNLNGLIIKIKLSRKCYMDQRVLQRNIKIFL